VGIETSPAVEGGLGLIGNAQNQFVLAKHGKQLELSHVTASSSEVLWKTELDRGQIIWLRVSSDGHADASFSYSFDQKNWLAAGSTVSLAGLPPWDQGLRIGLVSNGPPSTLVSFAHFTLLDTNQ
jgi:hypothetical protein